MKLIMKTFLVVGSAIALFLSVIFLFIWPALLKDANQMDKRTVLKELQRIESHLSSQADVLNRTNLDWAVWDDTFLFLKGEYPDYPAVNLLPETFENNQVNFMLFSDGSGSNIYQSAYDLKRVEPIRLPAEYYEDFSRLDKAQGYVMTELGLAFYSKQPVYKSDSSGTAAGSLVMGKFWIIIMLIKWGKSWAYYCPSVNRKSRAKSWQ